MIDETVQALGALVTLVEALESAQIITLDGLEVMEWQWINPAQDDGLLLRFQTDVDGSCFFTADCLLALQQTDSGWILPDEDGEPWRLEVA